MQRPDLTDLNDEVIAYIEHLEAQLAAHEHDGESSSAPPEPSEEPTSINLITWSRAGYIKRTPRHFYGRQKRGGMGVFDLEMGDDDQPQQLLLADEASDLIAVTNFARIFRLPVSQITATEVRAKGQLLRPLLEGVLHEKEHVVCFLSGEQAHVAVLTPRGYVFTKSKLFLKDGVQLYDTTKYGAPVAVCWTGGQDDLLLVTRQGQAIRFMEKQVPKGGILGMRLDEGDEFVGITAVRESGGAFLMTADGKGTIRLMEGFRQNKSPGAGGKVIIKSEAVVTAVAAQETDDIFAISRLGKLIRFSASDVPAKTGVVQGVHCMNLRADEVTAVVVAVL
jgi:DNA gyrase subunit A